MAHKLKEIIPTNLWKIRKELKLTQKQMAEFLGVTERMIQMYEEEKTTLPLDKAIYISNKWNYSLDQIYFDFDKSNKPSGKFTVDIRDFLSRTDDQIIFSIPDYYWDYLKKYNDITESDILSEEKDRLLAELNSKYDCETNSIIWKCELSISDFLSLIKFGNNEIPFADIDRYDKKNFKPSKTQIDEVTAFLNQISKGEHN